MSIIAVLFIGLIFVVADALLIQETIDDVKTFRQDGLMENMPKIFKMVLFGLLILMQILFAMYVNKDKQPETPKKDVVEYECPIVADTVKNDWAKDSTIRMEKRLVYEQMLNDIDR